MDDERDATIRELRQQVVTLQRQLAAASIREGSTTGHTAATDTGNGDSGSEHKTQGGDGRGLSMQDGIDTDAGAMQHEEGSESADRMLEDAEATKAAYVQSLEGLAQADILNDLRAHGLQYGDLKECMSISSDDAVKMFQDTVSEMDSRQLREVLKVLGDDLSAYAAAQRDRLAQLFGQATGTDPDSVEADAVGLMSGLDELEVEWAEQPALIERLTAILLPDDVDVDGIPF